MLHDSKAGYLMVKRRIDLLQRIDYLSKVQVHEVPEESRFLLEIDTNELTQGEVEGQEYWVCAMEAAIGASSAAGTMRANVGSLRPQLRIGGAFSLLEAIRLEWLTAMGCGPRDGASRSLSWTYPVSSVAHAEACLPSNICRKPD
jgi:hypothetical protein